MDDVENPAEIADESEGEEMWPQWTYCYWCSVLEPEQLVGKTMSCVVMRRLV